MEAGEDGELGEVEDTVTRTNEDDEVVAMVSLGRAEVRSPEAIRGRQRRQLTGDSYAAASICVRSSQARTRRGACGRRGSPVGSPKR